MPTIAAALRGLPANNLILDGELVALDKTGKPSVYELSGRIKNASEAQHEHVHVGGGAEGLVAHAMELGIERGASADMRADAGDSSAAGDSKPGRKRCAFRFRIRTAPATPHRAR